MPMGDTPERIDAERARYRAILDAALDPIITIDEFGTIESASRSVHRVFGWTPDEIIGRDVSMLMPEPHRSRHGQYLSNYRSTGETNILGRVREFTARHKNGHDVPIDLCVSRVDVPGRAQPLFTAVIHDLTQRKVIEDALIDAERRLRVILERIDLIGVGLDRDGRITFANDALLERTGWSHDDVIGVDWFERFILPEERDAVHAVFRAAVQHGELVANFENHIRTRTDGRRLINWHNAVNHDTNGRIIGVMALGQDITEQRRNEEERARHHDELEELVEERTRALESTHEQLRLTDRLASIGTLAAGLGHDMNNVLLPIRCRLDVLDHATLTPAIREHFIAVRNSIEYLQQLTDGLHLLALDPDDPGASQGETNVSTWWARLRPLLEKAMPSSGTLTSSIADDLPPVAVPSHRLSQAVLNLVVNAAEAIPDRGTVHVWARAFTDGRFVTLGVTDDGYGMSARVRRRALDPFFTTKTRGLGTGLGLSLVHGVVRAAGGSMDIESSPDTGTTVSLVLPTVAQAAQHEAKPSRPLTATIRADDPRLRALLTSMVSASGFTLAASPDDDTDVLITDRADLDGGTARRVLMVGVSPAEVQLADNTHILEHAEDFDGLRDVLRECRQMLESSPS